MGAVNPPPRNSLPSLPPPLPPPPSRKSMPALLVFLASLRPGSAEDGADKWTASEGPWPAVWDTG